MSFASECGIPKGLGLLFRSHDASAWHGFHLAEPYALIGTSPQCNVRIPDDGMEPCHAYLQYHNGRLLACDLTGRGGVKHDGSPIAAEWFAPDTEFEIGRFQVRVAAIDDDRCELSAQPLAHATADYAAIEISLACGPEPQRRAQSTKDVILIGQSPDCDFGVDELGVAPLHCSLVRTDGMVWIVDLGAGTSVNGEMLSHAMLDPEARLCLGSAEVTVNWSGISADRSLRTVDPSYTMIPARTKTTPPASSIVQAASPPDGRDELVLSLVEDLEESHRQAFEDARRMVRDVLISHERMHREQIDAMQRQQDHLVGIINSLIGSRGAQPPAHDLSRLPQLTHAGPPVASPEAPDDDQFDVSLTLEADPEIKDAWLRGQLQAIDENLKNSQTRGFKKFLRRLRRQDQQAFN